MSVYECDILIEDLVAELTRSANKGFYEPPIRGSAADDEEAEEECKPLQKLTPAPTVSLGGYLDYQGWRDCERFLELDTALKRRLCKKHDSAPRGCSNGATQSLNIRRCVAILPGGSRCGERFEVTTDYAGSRCLNHRNRLYNRRIWDGNRVDFRPTGQAQRAV